MRPGTNHVCIMAVVLATLPLISSNVSLAADDDDAAPAIDAKLDALLDRIEKRAADIKSLSAKLTYTRIQGLVGDTQKRLGTLDYVAGPPGKFRVHFDRLIEGKRPVKKDSSYIFDGVWLVERISEGGIKRFIKRQIVPPDAKPGEKDPLRISEGPFPVPLKADKKEMLARFDIKQMPTEGEKHPADSVCIRLVPRKGRRTDLVQIDIWYHEKTLTPMRAATVDSSENESVVDLRDVAVNEKIDAKRFSTDLPKDGGWHIEVKAWRKK